MSEPRATADRLQEVLPGVFNWHVDEDDRIGSRSDAWAIVRDGRVVLVDPLPIAEEKLRALGEVEAIVLTAGNHQRTAWRFRKVFGAPVYAPVDAYRLEHAADHSYSGGDLLPGGLVAFHAPGPVESMHALWLERPVSVVFVSDLLVSDGKTLSFVSAEYQDEPHRSRSSVARLLKDLPIVAVCPSHGPAIVANGADAMRRALDEDDETLAEQPVI
jgi:glyoxylase-like metal-dependent hydrolase (beta-lactamase superfamily II)